MFCRFFLVTAQSDKVIKDAKKRPSLEEGGRFYALMFVGCLYFVLMGKTNVLLPDAADW